MSQAGQKRKAALQAEKEGNKDQFKKLWAESQALYDEADKIVNTHWKSVAGRKKELEDRLKEITTAIEPASGDIILSLVVNEQHPQETRRDETVVVIGQTGKIGPALKVKQVRMSVTGISSWRTRIEQLVDRTRLEALLGR